MYMKLHAAKHMHAATTLLRNREQTEGRPNLATLLETQLHGIAPCFAAVSVVLCKQLKDCRHSIPAHDRMVVTQAAHL